MEAIKVLPRAIPLFDQVSGPGNSSSFRVVGFGGIRIMNVRLTGALRSKQVIIQPAFVVEPAVTSGGPWTSTYAYTPPMLTR